MALVQIPAPAVEGMTLLATATPSAATTLSFDSIPTSYKHLKLIWRNVTNSSNYWFVRFNNNSSAIYHVNGIANSSSTSSAINAFRESGNTTAGGGQVWQNPINGASSFGGELNIYRYAQLEQRKFDMQSGTETNTMGFFAAQGYFNETSNAITSINFIRSSTNTITGTFYLYGVN